MEEEKPSENGNLRFGCRGCLTIGVVCLACLWMAHWWFGPIRYLQFHASRITDEYDDAGAGFTGDFTRKITAECTEEVFHRYAALQGLTQQFKSNAEAKNFPKGFNIPDLTGAYYFQQAGGKDVILAYYHGRLYYYINVC